MVGITKEGDGNEQQQMADQFQHVHAVPSQQPTKQERKRERESTMPTPVLEARPTRKKKVRSTPVLVLWWRIKTKNPKPQNSTRTQFPSCFEPKYQQHTLMTYMLLYQEIKNGEWCRLGLGVDILICPSSRLWLYRRETAVI